jgi:HK97 family phage major capsid protein
MANRLGVLTERKKSLTASIRALLEPPEGDPSQEQKLEASTLLTDLGTVNSDLEALAALHAAERAQTGAVPIVVTERAEDDPKRGFANVADFALAVKGACRPTAGHGDVDPRLLAFGQPGIKAAPTNFHEEGHSNDGYMVPPEYRADIWKLVFEDEDLLSLVNPEPTSSNAVSGLVDESTPWGATGIKAYWTAEGAQKTQSRLSTQNRMVILHKLAALVLTSDELLEDAPRLNARLTTGAARAIAWEASEAIMWGNGVAKPLGWMEAPSKIAVAKEVGQTAATIIPDNLTKMFTRIMGGAGSRMRWLANRDIVPQLVSLRIGDEPSWIGNNGGLRDAPNGMLLGLPMQFTEHAHTLGTEGDLQLVNLSGYYATVKSGGPQFAQSIHLYFDYDITAFRWVFRLGGMPYLSAPVAPAHGNTTKSHFVTLATRA